MYLALEKPLQKSLKSKFTSPASTTLGKVIFKPHVPVLKEFLQCYINHQLDDSATSPGCHAFSKLVFQFSFTLCPFTLSSPIRATSHLAQFCLPVRTGRRTPGLCHSKRSGIKPFESKIGGDDLPLISHRLSKVLQGNIQDWDVEELEQSPEHSLNVGK
jgi:hypothetical protein